MIELLVIADDFTGAVDTGVQFSKKGIPTMVTVDEQIDFHALPEEVCVLVADTESRHSESTHAAQCVARIAELGISYGIKYFYKKTDSTLRGNIGSELEALMKVCATKYIMFLPAYPKMCRTTLGGRQFINGVPLNETSFSCDPLEPAVESFIPSIIAKQSGANVRICTKFSLPDKEPEEQPAMTVYVFDAQSDQDLLEIGKGLNKRGFLQVSAGCAGFAEYLPEVLELKTTSHMHPRKNHSKVLTVCGSVNVVSQRQVRYAQSKGFKVIRLDVGNLLDKRFSESDAGLQLIDDSINALNRGEKLIVETYDASGNVGCFKTEHCLAIVTNLGVFISRIFKTAKLDSLVVFGGDTAIGILRALGCRGIVPREEIAPGVAISESIVCQHKFDIVTKAGGFGEDDILPKIYEHMNLKIPQVSK
jgi:uncharacterized protein YgbK (DUF1537 family)